MSIEQSRRDDLESLGYVLINFLKGVLPWQGIKANNRIEKFQKIFEKKITTPIEEMCEGLPNEFIIYLSYCRSLKFEDKPDYHFQKKLFRDLFDREGYEYNYFYDWMNPVMVIIFGIL